MIFCQPKVVETTYTNEPNDARTKKIYFDLVHSRASIKNGNQFKEIKKVFYNRSYLNENEIIVVSKFQAVRCMVEQYTAYCNNVLRRLILRVVIHRCDRQCLASECVFHCFNQ